MGAYYKDELIGFLKVVYIDQVARLMQILSMAQHNDKRPLNALIASAVKICEQRGCTHLIYGKYTYAGKRESSMVDFKKRNGFIEIKFPRYYVPLNIKGSLAVTLRLYGGIKPFLPQPLLKAALKVRSKNPALPEYGKPSCWQLAGLMDALTESCLAA